MKLRTALEVGLNGTQTLVQAQGIPKTHRRLWYKRAGSRSSDLDEATQRQLIRGAQLRELLKQAPAQPLSVVQQVAIIYTGTRTSLLDNVGDLTAFMVVGQGPLFGRMRAVEPYPEIVRAIDLVGR